MRILTFRNANIDIPNANIDIPNANIDITNRIIDISNRIIDIPNRIIDIPECIIGILPLRRCPEGTVKLGHDGIQLRGAHGRCMRSDVLAPDRSEEGESRRGQSIEVASIGLGFRGCVLTLGGVVGLGHDDLVSERVLDRRLVEQCAVSIPEHR